MINEKESFQKMALLTGARIFGILFSIAIPMYLGRKLSIETYGTYKQIMLVFWFAQVALNLGVDDAAYFYLRRDPKNFPFYSFNALLFNLFFTCSLWALMVFFKTPIGHLIKNEQIIDYIPLTGLLLVMTVCSMQIEGILISLNRFKERLYLEMGMEILKSMAIIGSFYFFDSIRAVLISLSTLMFCKLIYTFVVIHEHKLKSDQSYFQGLIHLKKQLKFGLPLGTSRVLQNLLNIENFFISSYFSLIQFTYYTIGCFENPIINASRASLYELVNIELIDSEKEMNHQKSIMIWQSMNRKLFLIVLPFTIYMMFFAKELISFIFSIKYLESAPFFIVFNFYVIAGCLNPEPIFRATSHTKLTLKLRIAGIILGALGIYFGAVLSGPLMALVGKTVAMGITNIIGLYIGAKLLEANLKDLFNWREIFKISILSLVFSLFISLAFHYIKNTYYKEVFINPFLVLAFSFSFYFVVLIICFWKLNVFKDEEKQLILQKLMKIFQN